MAGRNVNPGVAELRQPGMIESFQVMLRACTEYFLARFELAGLESKDAFGKILKAVVACVAALLCLAAGFLYLSLSLVYILAVKAAWGWGWALSGTGLIMLIITAAGLFFAKAVLQGFWFPVTTSELKKDIEWLKSKPTV